MQKSGVESPVVKRRRGRVEGRPRVRVDVACKKELVGGRGGIIASGPGKLESKASTAQEKEETGNKAVKKYHVLWELCPFMRKGHRKGGKAGGGDLTGRGGSWLRQVTKALGRKWKGGERSRVGPVDEGMKPVLGHAGWWCGSRDFVRERVRDAVYCASESREVLDVS